MFAQQKIQFPCKLEKQVPCLSPGISVYIDIWYDERVFGLLHFWPYMDLCGLGPSTISEIGYEKLDNTGNSKLHSIISPSGTLKWRMARAVQRYLHIWVSASGQLYAHGNHGCHLNKVDYMLIAPTCRVLYSSETPLHYGSLTRECNPSIARAHKGLMRHLYDA